MWRYTSYTISPYLSFVHHLSNHIPCTDWLAPENKHENLLGVGRLGTGSFFKDECFLEVPTLDDQMVRFQGWYDIYI